MVERCKHCGSKLHPAEIIVAYRGNLYCDMTCAAHEAAKTIFEQFSINNHRLITWDKAVENAKLLIKLEAEEVRACDIGITAALCPFMFADTDKHECTPDCVAYYNGKCSIVETFKNHMEG